MLQLQGRKRWRVYSPIVPLASFSSGDLDRAMLGVPLIDAVLEPGDMLYMPRGTIHEASTALGSSLSHGGSAFSTHVTLSTYQQQAWAPLLERALCAAIQQAEAEMIQLRRGVPIGAFRQLGVVHRSEQPCADGRHAVKTAAARALSPASGRTANKPEKKMRPACSLGACNSGASETRRALQAKATELLQHILRNFNASLDCAADDMAADFVQARMPPHKTDLAQGAEGPGGDERVARTTLVRFRDVDCLRLVSCQLLGGAVGNDGDCAQVDGGQGAEGVRLLTSRYLCLSTLCLSLRLPLSPSLSLSVSLRLSLFLSLSLSLTHSLSLSLSLSLSSPPPLPSPPHCEEELVAISVDAPP